MAAKGRGRKADAAAPSACEPVHRFRERDIKLGQAAGIVGRQRNLDGFVDVEPLNHSGRWSSFSAIKATRVMKPKAWLKSANTNVLLIASRPLTSLSVGAATARSPESFAPCQTS
jgi:hypothetical protein